MLIIKRNYLLICGLLILLACGLLKLNNHLNQKHMINQIGKIVLEYALRYDIDKRSVDTNQEAHETPIFTGFNAIKDKIAQAVHDNKPIEFNVVGFPYKSQNTARKVAVPYADEAEQHSLEYLHTLLTKIGSMYAPSAVLTIFTDGTVFCDVTGVGDETVFSYEKQLKQLTAHMPQIKILTLSTLLPKQSPAAMRTTIETFAPSDSEFAQRLKQDPKLQHEIDLMEKRLTLEFDYPTGHLYIKEHPIAEIAKKLVQRSMQYSSFLATMRDNTAIRLSVHYQLDVTTKMGIKLSATSHVTPWHGVLVVNTDGSKRIQHLEDRVD